MIVANKIELAKALGVSLGTIYNWTKKGMPEQPGNTYNVEEVQTWRRSLRKDPNRLEPRVDVTDNGSTDNGVPILHDDLRKWSIEYRKAKAIRETLEVQKMRGILVKKEDVSLHQGQMFSALRRRFMAMGRRLGPELAEQDARKITAGIDAEVAAILNDLATRKNQEE